jgi:5-(carboxyamino)imidazole ribonucleotide synthase
MKLGPTETAPAFVMLNILGPDGIAAKADVALLPTAPPSLHLHWYDKEEIRPGRKLGHLNARANSVAELNALVDEMKSWQDRWIENLKRNASQ